MTSRRTTAHLLLLSWFCLSSLIGGCRTATDNPQVRTVPTIEEPRKPSGLYDAELVTAIQKRWYILTEKRPAPHGKVVVEFKSRSDGTLDEIKVIDSDLDEFSAAACRKAVEGVSPFRPWSQEMKDEMKSDTRMIRYTFYYN